MCDDNERGNYSLNSKCSAIVVNLPGHPPLYFSFYTPIRLKVTEKAFVLSDRLVKTALYGDLRCFSEHACVRIAPHAHFSYTQMSTSNSGLEVYVCLQVEFSTYSKGL